MLGFSNVPVFLCHPVHVPIAETYTGLYVKYLLFLSHFNENQNVQKKFSRRTIHKSSRESLFLFFETYIHTTHLDIIKVFFYSPTDKLVNCLKNNFKIYIKIDIKTALTHLGAVTPSSGSALLVLAKVTVVKKSQLIYNCLW